MSKTKLSLQKATDMIEEVMRDTDHEAFMFMGDDGLRLAALGHSSPHHLANMMSNMAMHDENFMKALHLTMAELFLKDGSEENSEG